MNPALNEYLANKYPLIIGKTYIGVGDGWFFILDALFGSIQSRIDRTEAWAEASGSTVDTIPQVKLLRIKEKFGTLRLLHEGGDSVISGMVAFAMTLSGRVCEKCGVMDASVGQSGDGWIKTHCAQCVSPEKRGNHFKDRNQELIEIWGNIKKGKYEGST